jgi:hypothetical protein
VKDVEVQVPTLVSMRLEKSSLGAVQSMSGWQVCHGNDIPADRPVSVTIANVPPASELFTDDPSVIQLTISYQVVEFREQQNGLWAGVYQVCELGNSSKRIYRNASGIYLGMPRDFAGNPQLEDNGPDVTLVPKRGVGVSGPVAPGGRTVKFGYFLPTKGGQLVHTQTTSSKIDSYNVAAIARPGLTISGAGLSPTEERPAPHGSSEKILVAFSSAPVAAGSSFTFTMDGLPAETAHGPLGVTIAGGLFALGAIVAGERWRRSARRRGERAALEQDRERLFGELVGLEAGHGQGQVGDDAYRSRRGTLMNQLESVTLKLSEVP